MRGWEVELKPFTMGLANCMAVWLRMRVTKSRISIHLARTVSSDGAGRAFHMAWTVSTGPTVSGGVSRNCQTVFRYLALTFDSAATVSRVAVGLPSATRCL